MIRRLRGLVGRFRRSRVGARLALLQARSAREIFRKIYQDNYWGNSDSRSGAGSDLSQTAEVRERLPELINALSIQTMLDIPCGDLHWMKELSLNVDYVGADIVPELIQRNKSLYGNGCRSFATLDLTSDDLPRVDLVFSRDVMVHLSFEDVFAALNNIRRSGSKYLLTTTFTKRLANTDIPTGHWRPLNFQKPPFNFLAPIQIINERCTEGDGSWGDKSLGLWRVCDIPASAAEARAALIVIGKSDFHAD
jgi:hypothetical protein